MTRHNRWDLEARERARRDVAALAARMLAGDVAIIAGAQRMTRLAYDVVDDVWADEDFAVFAALDTETDHLPLAEHRPLWQEQAFAEKWREVVRIQDKARPEVFAACRSLLRRYGAN